MPYKKLFFLLIVKPLVFVIMGLHIRYRERLPINGPAIIVANHNSHLDTLVLMSLYSSNELSKVRPVAASDYFMRNAWSRWLACNLIDIIPLERGGRKSARERLQPIHDALDNNEIVILFPEGSRGEAELITHFKRGIALLAEQHPETPITPVFLHGLGKCLPRGEGMFVPFICDVIIGEPLYWQGETDSADAFVNLLEANVLELGKDITSSPWV
ncbi:MAG: lysophospholipid acyltransferase family protein [Thiotrichaceae bacterium]